MGFFGGQGRLPLWPRRVDMKGASPQRAAVLHYLADHGGNPGKMERLDLVLITRRGDISVTAPQAAAMVAARENSTMRARRTSQY